MLNGAVPPFYIDGGTALVLTRALWVTALLSTFGTLIFRIVIVPKTLKVMARQDEAIVTGPVDRLTWFGLGAALVTGSVWLVLQTQAIAGTNTFSGVMTAVPTVLLHTAFGHVWAAQMALVLLGALCTRRSRCALAMLTLATILQAGHGHAAFMESEGPWLFLASVVHLLAAGGWLGGLLPLLLVVQRAPAKAAATAARWFSPCGKLCVVVVAGSAAYQAWVMVGSLSAVVGTAYGWLVVIKLVLLGVLFAFAVLNRYRLAPALTRTPTARRALVLSLALQNLAGVAVIIAAAVLTALPPGMHIPVVWPFTQTVSLATIDEDPDFKREVVAALLALTAAAVLLALAIVIRRAPWLQIGAALAAGILAWLAIPHLDLLFVEAYPTSYQTSPTQFAATSIVQGAALFPAHCANCHGLTGRGDGPEAAALAVPPANLTEDHLWMHSDGDLSWWLSHGIAAPDGQLAMPGFAGSLTEHERWALIDYIRAHNAGLKFASTSAWSPQIQAPGFEATCAGHPVALADLRGHAVRVVIGAAPAGPSDPDVLTINTAGPATSGGPCVTSDSSVGIAYGIVSGISAGELSGVEFLVDGDGWLRAVQRPGAALSWDDPAVLASEIAGIEAHPIRATSAATMHMQM